MAFSDAEKAKIIRWTGYSMSYNWNDALIWETLGKAELIPSVVAEVRAILARIEAIDGDDGKLVDAMSDLDVVSLGKGDIVFNLGQIDKLKEEGYRQCVLLSTALGIPIRPRGLGRPQVSFNY